MTPNKPTTLKELRDEFYELFVYPNQWKGQALISDEVNGRETNGGVIFKWFQSKFTSHNTELIQKIEGMRKEEWESGQEYCQNCGGNGCITCNHYGAIQVQVPLEENRIFNSALDQVISLINQE